MEQIIIVFIIIVGAMLIAFLMIWISSKIDDDTPIEYHKNDDIFIIPRGIREKDKKAFFDYLSQPFMARPEFLINEAHIKLENELINAMHFGIIKENKMEERYKFQEGDLVSFAGIEGTVKIEPDLNTIYRVSACGEMFTLDGFFEQHHKEPLLKLVRKAPIKTVIKYKYAYTVPNGITGQVHISEYCTLEQFKKLYIYEGYQCLAFSMKEFYE